MKLLFEAARYFYFMKTLYKTVFEFKFLITFFNDKKNKNQMNFNQCNKFRVSIFIINKKK